VLAAGPGREGDISRMNCLVGDETAAAGLGSASGGIGTRSAAVGRVVCSSFDRRVAERERAVDARKSLARAIRSGMLRHRLPRSEHGGDGVVALAVREQPAAHVGNRRVDHARPGGITSMARVNQHMFSSSKDGRRFPAMPP